MAQAGHGLVSERWPDDVDELAALYDDELNSILDRILPLRQYDRRARPSDPWFDKECRDAKRLTAGTCVRCRLLPVSSSLQNTK